MCGCARMCVVAKVKGGRWVRVKVRQVRWEGGSDGREWWTRWWSGAGRLERALCTLSTRSSRSRRSIQLAVRRPLGDDRSTTAGPSHVMRGYLRPRVGARGTSSTVAGLGLVGDGDGHRSHIRRTREVHGIGMGCVIYRLLQHRLQRRQPAALKACNSKTSAQNHTHFLKNATFKHPIIRLTFIIIASENPGSTIDLPPR